jgi:hypothetical protein
MRTLLLGLLALACAGTGAASPVVAGDAKPGDIRGQGSVGLRYTLGPTGRLIKKIP